MGYHSALRVPPNDQEVRETLGPSTGLRDGAQVVIRPRTDILCWREHRWTHATGWDIRSVHHSLGWCCHWDATNEREDRENTGRIQACAIASQVAFTSPPGHTLRTSQFTVIWSALLPHHLPRKFDCVAGHRVPLRTAAPPFAALTAQTPRTALRAVAHYRPSASHIVARALDMQRDMQFAQEETVFSNLMRNDVQLRLSNT
ncbi:hypothetical protein C8J57DRAFT_1715935 [Mycena rebaudengoi]|nr:hypothetical protein C8J57DRAFT_1715935 [Mycena rebaudengoi]